MNVRVTGDAVLGQPVVRNRLIGRPALMAGFAPNFRVLSGELKLSVFVVIKCQFLKRLGRMARVALLFFRHKLRPMHIGVARVTPFRFRSLKRDITKERLSKATQQTLRECRSDFLFQSLRMFVTS